MRAIAFSKRTFLELVRDPLSYIFCVGFPIIMLLIMNIINESLPKEAQVEMFHISRIGPGICLFGLTFVMLFTALQVSKDRSTAFLLRIYASPMSGSDFIVGYTLPVLGIAVLQQVITFIVVFILGKTADYNFHVQNLLLSILVLVPSALIFIGFGLFFGTLLNDKAAPGVCSIIISLACMVGGVWMDVDAISGMFQKVCKALPFYQGNMAARNAANGNYGDIGKPLLITLAYGVVIYLLAIWLFEKKRQKDLR